MLGQNRAEHEPRECADRGKKRTQIRADDGGVHRAYARARGTDHRRKQHAHGNVVDKIRADKRKRSVLENGKVRAEEIRNRRRSALLVQCFGEDEHGNEKGNQLPRCTLQAPAERARPFSAARRENEGA